MWVPYKHKCWCDAGRGYGCDVNCISLKRLMALSPIIYDDSIFVSTSLLFSIIIRCLRYFQKYLNLIHIRYGNGKVLKKNFFKKNIKILNSFRIPYSILQWTSWDMKRYDTVQHSTRWDRVECIEQQEYHHSTAISNICNFIWKMLCYSYSFQIDYNFNVEWVNWTHLLSVLQTSDNRIWIWMPITFISFSAFLLFLRRSRTEH